MSAQGEKCKLAYAADGTLICDPKQKGKLTGYFANHGCSAEQCTVFGKVCIKSPSAPQSGKQ